MFNYDITEEDTRTIITEQPKQTKAEESEPSKFSMCCSDALTGDSYHLKDLTREQIQAVMLLIVAADETTHIDIDSQTALYIIVENILELVPAHCRPIP